MKVHKSIHFTDTSLIVTVDFGKKNNFGFMRTIRSEEVKPFKFTNDLQGFNLFWNKISSFRSVHCLQEIYFGFEPTGSYGHPLIYFMKNKGCRLIQVNPKHTKRVKEVVDNSPNKTDKKDPRVIADIMLLGHAMCTVIPEGHKADLRCLINAREVLMAEETRICNQLEGLLATYFPEFLQIMPVIKSKTSIYVLEKYTLPGRIRSVSLKKLTCELRKVSRYQLSTQRIKNLHRSAVNTVGLPENDGMELSTQLLVKRLKSAIEDTKDIERKIIDTVKKLPEANILLSIKGIKFLTVAYILGELGDLDQYASKSSLLKMAGLNLFEISSGAHKGKRRITKRGRAFVRKALYLATLNMLKEGGIHHQYYKKRCQAGKNKMKTIVALMKKLLVTMYVMVNNKQMFIEDYEMKSAA